MEESMSGYYRFPTVCRDTIVFVCEDDLWTVPVEGGIARRLTSNLGATSSPRLSPDGERLAFTGREEGPSEVYVMSALGGEAKRLTYQGGNAAMSIGTPMVRRFSIQAMLVWLLILGYGKSVQTGVNRNVCLTVQRTTSISVMLVGLSSAD